MYTIQTFSNNAVRLRDMCFSPQIGCLSEGETELSPNAKRVLCSGNGSAFSNSGNRMVFVDCPTLKLSIRSSTYDFKHTFPFLFSVHGTSMSRSFVSNLIWRNYVEW